MASTHKQIHTYTATVERELQHAQPPVYVVHIFVDLHILPTLATTKTTNQTLSIQADVYMAHTTYVLYTTYITKHLISSETLAAAARKKGNQTINVVLSPLHSSPNQRQSDNSDLYVDKDLHRVHMGLSIKPRHSNNALCDSMLYCYAQSSAASWEKSASYPCVCGVCKNSRCTLLCVIYCLHACLIDFGVVWWIVRGIH